MAYYLISGLRVASDLALPGAIQAAGAADGSAGQADLVIATGPVPDSLTVADLSGPNWQLQGERFLLRVPGVVRMLLDGGRRITWQCEAGTAPEDAAIFVAASGIGLSLHQRGCAVLHAGAVAVDGRAVLFCGPSGAGKSTMAAALAERGHRLLADDQCVLSGLQSPAVLVHPDGRAMKLWQQAIDQLDLAERSGAAVRSQIRKFYVEPQATAAAPLPLGAIYLLQEARAPQLAKGGSGIAVQRLNLADAALEVGRNAYRPAMVRRLDQAGLYLQAAAGAARAGGVFRLIRPLNYDAIPAVVAALRAHWREDCGWSVAA